jgi:hypothetical protein
VRLELIANLRRISHTGDGNNPEECWEIIILKIPISFFRPPIQAGVERGFLKLSPEGHKILPDH